MWEVQGRRVDSLAMEAMKHYYLAVDRHLLKMVPDSVSILFCLYLHSHRYICLNSFLHLFVVLFSVAFFRFVFSVFCVYFVHTLSVSVVAERTREANRNKVVSEHWFGRRNG